MTPASEPWRTTNCSCLLWETAECWPWQSSLYNPHNQGPSTCSSQCWKTSSLATLTHARVSSVKLGFLRVTQIAHPHSVWKAAGSTVSIVMEHSNFHLINTFKAHPFPISITFSFYGVQNTKRVTGALPSCIDTAAFRVKIDEPCLNIMGRGLLQTLPC